MAAAARSDARVPCPLCGGLIHPIAGRCKHCKGDVSAVRAARPAAGAALPALHPAAAATPQRLLGNAAAAGAGTNGHGPGANGHGLGANGVPAAPDHAPDRHAAYAGHGVATAHPQALVQAVAAAGPIPQALRGLGPAEESQQILPPRPTGRYGAAPPPRAAWKSWPVIVIVLAVIAIVTAVVLMVFPPGGTTADAGVERARDPRTPAPDRMDTQPTPTPRLPPSSGADPWAGPPAPAPAPTPRVPAPQVLPRGADPDADATDADPDADLPAPGDPDAVPGPGSALRDPFSRRGTGGGIGPQSSQMLHALFEHACAHAVACGSMTSELKLTCEAIAAQRVPAPTCAAATRCLRSIDELSCDVTLDDPMKVLQLRDQLADCAAALRC